MITIPNAYKGITTYIVGHCLVNGFDAIPLDRLAQVYEEHNVPKHHRDFVNYLLQCYPDQWGDNEDWQACAKHDSLDVKYAVIAQGQCLDLFLGDSHWLIRSQVARMGYGLDTLINDPEDYVRAVVAQQGYGLDVLVNDPCPDVRCAVALQDYGHDVLANDPHPDVRAIVADKMLGLTKLVDDLVNNFEKAIAE